MDSLFTNTPLSKDDFVNCNWEEVVENSGQKTCHSYSPVFWNKSQEAEKAGNTKIQIALAILSGITAPALKSESPEQPFHYMEVINNLSEEYLTVLEEWVSDLSDYELKARIADILWIRNKHKYKMAQTAIDSYLESAKLLEPPEHWRLSVKRIERAIRLAYHSNQKAHKQKVVAHVESVLSKYDGEDPLFLSAKLMELLLEFKEGNPSKYAPIAEKAAHRSEAESNWDKARNYWELAIVWHRKNRNPEQERLVSLYYAETYVKEAEDKIKQTPPSYLAASHFLIKAIEALTNMGGNQRRIEEIHQTLLDYQQKSTLEMQFFYSEKIDSSSIAGQFIDKIKGKKLDEALLTLAFLFNSTPVSEIKKRTQEGIDSSIFRDIFPNIYVNEMGKIVGHNPSFEDEMYRTAIVYQQAQAQAIIEPARYQINLEHYVQISDFYSIVVNNPFVPRGREEIYARGLYAGLTGDFLVAAHLLIPQIEHSLRCLVKNRGKITSWLDKGIQDEHIMSVLFEQHEAELKEILGEDIAFELIGLLNRKGFGSNLRNLMAHGLISSNGFYTAPIIYLWWLTLRLCFLPLIPQINSTQTNEP
jgi:hypothetical protein